MLLKKLNDTTIKAILRSINNDKLVYGYGNTYMVYSLDHVSIHIDHLNDDIMQFVFNKAKSTQRRELNYMLELFNYFSNYGIAIGEPKSYNDLIKLKDRSKLAFFEIDGDKYYFNLSTIEAEFKKPRYMFQLYKLPTGPMFGAYVIKYDIDHADGVDVAFIYGCLV